VPEDQAVRAIIGEASNQGYQGMLAVAVGIRNRGSLKGVYGVKAKHVDKEPEWVLELARTAWRESETNRIHSGTHWENIKAFGKPYWADSMTEVYRYRDHIFYK
jgi:spore germination cell wall hydrolase CwlJ-like protein